MDRLNKIKIALICFDNPFLKPFEGGKRGMLSRIESLKTFSNIELDIYLHNKITEGYSDNNLYNNENIKIRQCLMNHTLESCLSLYPICVSKRFSRKYCEMLNGIKYDIAIYEGEQVSAYRFENIVNAKYHILYMHDIESVYRSELAKVAGNLISKIGNYIESLKFKLLERNIEDFFDQIWFVSSEECNKLKNCSNHPDKYVYVPLPCIDVSNSVKKSYSKEILYVGDLTLRNNLLSIKWFIDNIFQNILNEEKSAILKIVGRINSEDIKQLQSPNTVIAGYVDDLSSLYNSACFIICPVLFGAGVKVKTIDSLGQGQIVVTTSKGIEGTRLVNGVHLIATDEIGETSRICIDILKNRDKYLSLAKSGLDFINSYHTISKQAELMRSQLELLIR